MVKHKKFLYYSTLTTVIYSSSIIISNPFLRIQFHFERYKELVTTLYTEPKNEEFLWSFLQTTDDVLLPAAHAPKKKKNKQKSLRSTERHTELFWKCCRGNVSKVLSSNKNTNAKDKVITID